MEIGGAISHTLYDKWGHDTSEYRALNPNRKMPTLEDDEFVLWESNAILFYMAAKWPECGLWPADLRGHGCLVGKKQRGCRGVEILRPDLKPGLISVAVACSYRCSKSSQSVPPLSTQRS